MKKIVPALGAATLALVLGAAAFAAPGDARRGPDASRNATLTRAEIQAQVTERFAKADANGDGVLNEADKAARTGQMFDRIDTDKNGSISRAEFVAAHSGAGGDHDGMDNGAMGGPGGRMSGRMGGAGAMLRMADTNNDGAVTRDEALTAALKSFDRMDANKDGQVTPAERQAAMQAMGARMRGNGPGGDMPPPPPPPADDDQ